MPKRDEGRGRARVPTFGEYVDRLRHEAGGPDGPLTYREIALRTISADDRGLTEAMINHLVKGKREPGPRSLRALARAFAGLTTVEQLARVSIGLPPNADEIDWRGQVREKLSSAGFSEDEITKALADLEWARERRSPGRHKTRQAR